VLVGHIRKDDPPAVTGSSFGIEGDRIVTLGHIEVSLVGHHNSRPLDSGMDQKSLQMVLAGHPQCLAVLGDQIEHKHLLSRCSHHGRGQHLHHQSRYQ